MHAQVANCGAAAGSGGTLSTSQPTVCNDGTLWAPPTLTGYTAGLTRTEYVFADPSDIVFNEDSTVFGPRILEINTTGAFDAQAAGLSVGDQFEVTAFHYNLSNLQSFVDELLNGSFLFTPCCDFAELVQGIDVCSVYNSAGIFNGTDVADLNVWVASVQAFGGPASVNNIIFSFDEINLQAGQPCTGTLPLCYATSSTLTVDVACASSCSSATPPSNPSSVVGATRVDLSWDAIPGSVACQIKAERLVPAGPSPSQNLFGPAPSATSVPFAVLGNGTTWRWQVRCACSVSPIDATGFSTFDTFAVPVAREGELAPLPELTLFPNPATDLLYVESDFGMTELVVVDALGRTVRSTQAEAWTTRQELQIGDLPAGLYVLTARYGDRSQSTRFSVR
jgi:hypothetical protein